MKNWIIGISVGILMGVAFFAIAFADEKIIQVGVNNVEYTESYTVTDVNGVEFEVWGETEGYGQIRIDRELLRAQQKLTDANGLDAVQYKKDRQDDAQAEIDRLLLIQAEMDK